MFARETESFLFIKGKVLSTWLCGCIASSEGTYPFVNDSCYTFLDELLDMQISMIQTCMLPPFKKKNLRRNFFTFQSVWLIFCAYKQALIRALLYYHIGYSWYSKSWIHFLNFGDYDL